MRQLAEEVQATKEALKNAQLDHAGHHRVAATEAQHAMTQLAAEKAKLESARQALRDEQAHVAESHRATAAAAMQATTDLHAAKASLEAS